MKRNPRLQLEILLAVLAALCAALLALLVFVEPLLLIPPCRFPRWYCRAALCSGTMPCLRRA